MDSLVDLFEGDMDQLLSCLKIMQKNAGAYQSCVFRRAGASVLVGPDEGDRRAGGSVLVGPSENSSKRDNKMNYLGKGMSPILKKVVKIVNK